LNSVRNLQKNNREVVKGRWTGEVDKLYGNWQRGSYDVTAAASDGKKMLTDSLIRRRGSCKRCALWSLFDNAEVFRSIKQQFVDRPHGGDSVAVTSRDIAFHRARRLTEWLAGRIQCIAARV